MNVRSWQDALQRVIRMPLIYAALLGVCMQFFALRLPDPLMEGISLVADASIPTVMLVLGMQLAAITRKKVAYRYVTAVTIIRDGCITCCCDANYIIPTCKRLASNGTDYPGIHASSRKHDDVRFAVRNGAGSRFFHDICDDDNQYFDDTGDFVHIGV